MQRTDDERVIRPGCVVTARPGCGVAAIFMIWGLGCTAEDGRVEGDQGVRLAQAASLVVSTTASRTAWQMNRGEGILGFPSPAQSHGEQQEYMLAAIPPANDAGWADAPDPATIRFSEPSTLCGNTGCLAGGQFTYFQTFVRLTNAISSFTITLIGIDDGARVTLFNSAHPDGVIVGYAFLGQSAMLDMTALAKANEANRIVISQVDDCCTNSSLSESTILVNGELVVPVYFGVDTDSDPQHVTDSLLPSTTRFFIGRLGSGDDFKKDTFTHCSILDSSGKDVLTGGKSKDAGCSFDFESQQKIGVDTTYGYWLLHGPGDRLTREAKLHLENDAPKSSITDDHRAAATKFGRDQAEKFIEQLQRYATLIKRTTVFADLENGQNNTSGWFTCRESSAGSIPNNCPDTESLNELVINAFFDTLIKNQYTPGVYTNIARWIQYFSTSFIPADTSMQAIPFVAWTTGCQTSCAFRSDPVAALGSRAAAMNVVLGGSRTVIWQYYIPSSCKGVKDVKKPPHVDFDLTLDDPRDGFTPDMLSNLSPPTVGCSVR